MQDTDRKTFLGKLTMVSEYYGAQLTKPVIEMWWQAMAVYEAADFARAMDAHVRDPEAGRFMPKIADVVRRLDGTGEERAMRAWTEVRGALRRFGSCHSVQFADTVAAQVIEDMGGWLALGSMKTDEVPFRERDFCKRYSAYASRGGVVPHTGLLLGLYDAENLSKGFGEFVGQPALVGPVKVPLQITDGRRGELEPVGKAIDKLPKPSQEGRGGDLPVPAGAR